MHANRDYCSPSRTASAMNSSVFLSNFEKTWSTFTDGYFALFFGISTTDVYTPCALTLAISFSRFFHQIYRHRIERRNMRNRSVVVGCDFLIGADSPRITDLPLQNCRDHSRTACPSAVNTAERPTFRQHLLREPSAPALTPVAERS